MPFPTAHKRNRFDRLAKDIAREALALIGKVVTEKKIVAGAQYIDVWYEPDPARAAQRKRLGLLGRIAATPCLIEPYSDTPSEDELRACLHKHLAAWRTRGPREIPGAPPMLWILSTGRPAFAFQGRLFRRCGGFPRGVYESAAFLRVRLIVLTELPKNRSTLLVRLMGGRRVLLPATEELARLPADAPEREIAHLPVLRLHRQIAVDPDPKTPEEREFLMRAQNILQEYIEEGRKLGRAEGVAQGLAEGVARGVAQGVVALYEARFGAMPVSMRSKVEATTDDATLRAWLLVIGTGTAADAARAVSAKRRRPTKRGTATKPAS